MEPLLCTAHALERYRENDPLADRGDVVRAAALSLPVPPDAARILVGRAWQEDRPVDHWPRLHPEGAGLFVLCNHREGNGISIVTFLRFHSASQRELAVRWLLRPADLLREAFEAGFEAARSPGAPALAVSASERWLEGILPELPRLASHVAERTRAEGPAPSWPRRVHGLQQEAWTPPALEQKLALEEADPRLIEDVRRWGWLDVEGRRLVAAGLAAPGWRPEGPALLEPGARAVALGRPGRAGEPRWVFEAVRAVPVGMRHRLLAHAADTCPEG